MTNKLNLLIWSLIPISLVMCLFQLEPNAKYCTAENIAVTYGFFVYHLGTLFSIGIITLSLVFSALKNNLLPFVTGLIVSGLLCGFVFPTIANKVNVFHCSTTTKSTIQNSKIVKSHSSSAYKNLIDWQY